MLPVICAKIAYTSHDEAACALRACIKRRREANGLKVYRCHDCNSFHLGRNRRNGRKDRVRDEEHYTKTSRKLMDTYLELTRRPQQRGGKVT